MKWYLVKMVYQIICGEGNHTPQFDEQLRLIHADDDLHAFQKARRVGEKEQDNFLNAANKPVKWKFIDVSEMNVLNNFVDCAEMYSRIKEEYDAEYYIQVVKLRANHLLENSLQHAAYLN